MTRLERFVCAVPWLFPMAHFIYKQDRIIEQMHTQNMAALNAYLAGLKKTTGDPESPAVTSR